MAGKRGEIRNPDLMRLSSAKVLERRMFIAFLKLAANRFLPSISVTLAIVVRSLTHHANETGLRQNGVANAGKKIPNDADCNKEYRQDNDRHSASKASQNPYSP